MYFGSADPSLSFTTAKEPSFPSETESSSDTDAMYDELAARDAACLSCDDIIPADYEPSSPYSTATTRSACATTKIQIKKKKGSGLPSTEPEFADRMPKKQGAIAKIDVVSGEGTEQTPGGSTGPRKDGKETAKSFSTKELLEKLKRYGVAGVLSYGLLNTVYYVTAFLLVWFYFAPAPGRMGYGAAVERFVKLMAMVWAGSQVTKIFRAGGALALAPFVERGLRWFTVKFNFKSEGKAFAAIVGLCFAVAALMFFGLTILWA